MLLIFEMANNHMGNVDHGCHIIYQFNELKEEFPQFDYCFKFQYRDFPSYLHPDADEDNKYVKRFRETNLSLRDRHHLKCHAKNLGFLTACTPFDEASVRHIVEHEYDILKIGSPGATDWPLLNEIHYGWPTTKPIILSVGGLNEQEINGAIFALGREDLTLMHCISEYPTAFPYTGQVGWLQTTYPNCKVGFSSHQDPSQYIHLPYAHAYEFHVCLYPPPNEYSLTPENMRDVLATLNREYFTRIPGPKPTQFMRKKLYGDVMGPWKWKP